jgi:hypothetical protein
MKVFSPERLAQMLIESHLADSADITACSDLDISDIEGQYKVKLPEAYKHFLKAFGKSSSRVLSDIDLMYPAITRQAELVARTLRGFKMPANSYVFLYRIDTVLFFVTTEGDDPPVYRFCSGEEVQEKVFDSFSSWLTDLIVGEVEAKKELDALRNERSDREAKAKDSG